MQMLHTCERVENVLVSTKTLMQTDGRELGALALTRAVVHSPLPLLRLVDMTPYTLECLYWVLRPESPIRLQHLDLHVPMDSRRSFFAGIRNTLSTIAGLKKFDLACARSSPIRSNESLGACLRGLEEDRLTMVAMKSRDLINLLLPCAKTLRVLDPDLFELDGP